MALFADRRERALRKARKHGRPVMHLLHVGKSGGTAVKEALTRTRSETHEIVLHKHRVTLADVPAGEQVAFVLRDPLTRFVSGFYSRLREGRPRHYFPWNDEEREAFARFQTADELALALSSADPAEREAAERAMRGIRHVRDGYASWFGEPTAFLARSDDVRFIGRQERLSMDFERLRALLALPADARLPEADLSSHRTPDHYDRTLQQVAQANLRRWYGADYAFLELCREHADILGYVPPS